MASTCFIESIDKASGNKKEILHLYYTNFGTQFG